jgi:hypothetical protein
MARVTQFAFYENAASFTDPSLCNIDYALGVVSYNSTICPLDAIPALRDATFELIDQPLDDGAIITQQQVRRPNGDIVGLVKLNLSTATPPTILSVVPLGVVAISVAKTTDLLDGLADFVE